MKARRSNEGAYVVVFDAGDEVMDGLAEFAEREGVEGAGLVGIGAFRESTLAYFNVETREYEEIPVPEQVEVLSLAGDITLEEGRPKIHLHAVLGCRDGSVRGGHVMRAIVRPTLEVVVTNTASSLRRRYDPASGLALIDLSLTEQK